MIKRSCVLASVVMLAGCVSAENRQNLAEDRAECERGDKGACEMVPYDRAAIKRQVVHQVAFALALPIMVPVGVIWGLLPGNPFAK